MYCRKLLLKRNLKWSRFYKTVNLKSLKKLKRYNVMHLNKLLEEKKQLSTTPFLPDETDYRQPFTGPALQCFGRKRIRPILALQTAILTGGKLFANVCPGVNPYISLIHDDLPAMDNDDCEGPPYLPQSFWRRDGYSGRRRTFNPGF